MKKIKNSRMLRVLFARKSVVICTIILLVMIFMAIFAPLLSPYDPIKTDLMHTLEGPSWAHWLGTDGTGRDLLTRLMYGGRISFIVGFVSVFVAGIIGMLLGLLAGMAKGVVDNVIMRIMDAMMSIPMIVLALFLGALFGKGLGNICLAISICMIPGYARVTRGQVLTVRNSDYVTAGYLCGGSTIRNTFRHIFPNCISVNIVMMSLSLGGAILCEASLSYLGMGINPPTPTWGSMVSEGYSKLATHPILAIMPGVCIMLVVLCFSIVGDAMRDALDPKLRGTMGEIRKKKTRWLRAAKKLVTEPYKAAAKGTEAAAGTVPGTAGSNDAGGSGTD